MRVKITNRQLDDLRSQSIKLYQEKTYTELDPALWGLASFATVFTHFLKANGVDVELELPERMPYDIPDED